MAVTFDNARGTASSGATNSRGFLLTATTDACLLVFVNTDGTTSVSAVNIGATQLTRLCGTAYQDGNSRAEIWGLTAAPSGTLTISAILVGAGTSGMGLLGITYAGHTTVANPFGTVAVNTATAVASVSVTVSSTTTDLVVVAFPNRFFNPPSVTVGASITKRFFVSSYPSIIVGDVTGALATVCSGSATSAISWTAFGLSIVASAAAAGSIIPHIGSLGLLGCGH